MDQKELRELEAKCIQEQPAACVAACPLHVDARGLAGAVRKGDYAGGITIYKKTVPFPEIISRICDQPCQLACKRGEAGGAINVRALERACMGFNDKPAGKITLPPAKSKRVAVVGGGLSGLTTAFDLAKKGYQVTIFEAGELLGGRMRQFSPEMLPETAIETDLAVLKNMGVTINYHTKVSGEAAAGTTLDAICQDSDVVYLGLGQDVVTGLELGLTLTPEGRLEIDPVSFATSRDKVFAGGSQRLGLAKYSPVSSAADGRRAAISIDRFLQGVSLTSTRETEGPYATTLYTSLEGVEPVPLVAGSEKAEGYSREEALQEGQRCLQCQCLECVKVCEYLAHYRSYPKRYMREVYNNLSIVMGIHHANTMINTCSRCGLCAEVCPNGVNMGEVIREARQAMVEKGVMPISMHDFALTDLAYSNSEAFALAKHEPGFTTSTALFFPGCQLGASSPEQVKQAYAYLRSKISGGVGLMLGCCGAPAEWAGQQGILKETLQAIETKWREMGKPSIITACSSCYTIFKANLPEAKIESLWTVMERLGLPAGAGQKTGGVLAVHDACTTRHEPAIHESVRKIAQQLGYQLEELKYSGELTECCGYGGLMTFANREVAEKVIKRRIGQSGADYLTYCAMCRDNFAKRGKRTFHLLDIIFNEDGIDMAERQVPGYSDRRENRVKLKNSLLREVWQEAAQDPAEGLSLVIADDVWEVLEDRTILKEDIQQVLAHAEATGNKLKDSASGHYLAYYQPASVTYWVEYSQEGPHYIIHNAYCHRMEIAGK